MTHERPDLETIFAEGTLIDRALAKAVRETLILHKKLGYPAALWRDGEVVWVPADEIEIPPALEEEEGLTRQEILRFRDADRRGGVE